MKMYTLVALVSLMFTSVSGRSDDPPDPAIISDAKRDASGQVVG
jgi:hypothetical protein